MKRRDPFAIGFGCSFALHVLFVIFIIGGWGNKSFEPTGIVYSISLEGGSVLGGREQLPAKDKQILAPAKNVATAPEQPKVEEKPEPDAEISLKQPTKAPTPAPKQTPAEKPDKKVDQKKPEPKPTKPPEDKSKVKALQKDDVERDYQKALQRYLGESSDGGGKGFGAAKLGPGKGMGGGVQMPPEFFTYRQLLRSRIRSGWRWFDVKTSLVTRVSFRIDRQGEISDVQVVSSSGNREFDDSVLRAIAKANPLPPPPDSVYEQFKYVLMNFDPREL